VNVKSQQPFVHELALVEDGVEIGPGTRVWAYAHLRRGARIGAHCVIGNGVTVDCDVVLGDRCKVQNGALLFRGVRLGDGVFIGPGAVLTNDRRPRAVSASGRPLTAADWQLDEIAVDEGASVGANATVVAGVRVGAWALVGAGAVVTRDVAPHALVAGVPAVRRGWVCACGAATDAPGRMRCEACQEGAALTPSPPAG
jgi:UDP-2-acetamido-3-amino-2,3-dideoxy-glucuronate N-acetyltransferase